MLFVAFRNISALADLSDYEVKVFVNRRQIAGPFIVKGHYRDDGWKALVEKLVNNPLKEIEDVERTRVDL